jgi:hypothetical protein
MAALLARHRLDVSAGESVDDLAQMEQIAESTERVGANAGILGWRSPGLLCVPISPAGRNERPAAVRQDHENEDHAASSDAVDHGERPALEGMARAGDDHRIRNLTVMGSLWPLPSILSANPG